MYFRTCLKIPMTSFCQIARIVWIQSEESVKIFERYLKSFNIIHVQVLLRIMIRVENLFSVSYEYKF